MRRRDLIAPVLLATVVSACGGSSSETPPPLAPDLDESRPRAAASAPSLVQSGAAGATSGEVEPATRGEADEAAPVGEKPAGTWGARRRAR